VTGAATAGAGPATASDSVDESTAANSSDDDVNLGGFGGRTVPSSPDVPSHQSSFITTNGSTSTHYT